MDKNRRAHIRWIILAVLAVTLMVFGLIMGVQTFRAFDLTLQTVAQRDELAEELKKIGIMLMLNGGLFTVGAGILVILLMHVTSRSRREIRKLRQKNELMEQLNRQTRELAHHQRLETIGTLTSSIAHEFNNMLTPIMGYSMLTLEKLPPEEEELYDNILEIYNASRKAKVIISRLSDLSRKNTATTFRMASADELIRHTLDVANPARPENVQIKLDLNCWDQRIRANEIQISQLMLNLILNGFHAMEEKGGTLTVSTGFDEAFIHIRVADTGCGIPEDQIPKIFEPFYTTKETGKGTGLGLAIAAQVVEDHRGTIRVESVVGEGTVFTISLPRTAEAPE